MKRAIRYYTNGKMPTALVEYRAVVLSPGKTLKVGEASVSRFGYRVEWINMTYTGETVEPPDLATAVEMMKADLLKTGNAVSDEVYTGAEITDQVIEAYTELIPGSEEHKAMMKRYHDLMSAVTTRTWFMLQYDTTLDDGIRLCHIEGCGNSTDKLFYHCMPGKIMVPSKLRFPYNTVLKTRCEVRVEEYVPLDEAKLPGESDIDCIDRKAKSIVDSFREKTEIVDKLIAEHSELVDKTRRNIAAVADLAMIAISRRMAIDFYVATLYGLCNVYHKVCPSSSDFLDIPRRLCWFNSIVNLFCKSDMPGKYAEHTLSFEIDRELLDKFKESMLAYNLPDNYAAALTELVDDDVKLGMRLDFDDDNLRLVPLGKADPASSPYVE